MFDRYLVPLGSHLFILGVFLLAMLYAVAAHADVAVTNDDLYDRGIVTMQCVTDAAAEDACTPAPKGTQTTFLEYIQNMESQGFVLDSWVWFYELVPGRFYMIQLEFKGQESPVDIFVAIIPKGDPA
jgi:hypothetical protein